MFLSYKYTRHIGYDDKTNIYSCEFEITDSEWVEVVSGRSDEVGAPALGIVIDAYEKHNEPVAPNLFLTFQYITKQYGYTIEQIISFNKQYSPKYPKYEQEVQKYLMLL